MAREVHNAMAAGRPFKARAHWEYADVLAMTEHGWPAKDHRAFSRTLGASERWRLLLDHRERTKLAKKKLTPKEVMKGLEDGFLDSEAPGVCEAAWEYVRSGAHDLHDSPGFTFTKWCAKKRFIPQIWELARGKVGCGRFGCSRDEAYFELCGLGEEAWLGEVLADMARPAPSLAPAGSAYHLALAKAPKAVARILDAKLSSGEKARMRFVMDFLDRVAFWDNIRDTPFDVPIDFSAARKAVLRKSCDDGLCNRLAPFLHRRAPREALLLIEAIIAHRRRAKAAGRAAPLTVADGHLQRSADIEELWVLSRLPPEVGGPLVRRLLHSNDPEEAMAMAGGILSPAGSSQDGSPVSPYFPDLLDYDQRTSNGVGKKTAAYALYRLSHIPDHGPDDAAPEVQQPWVKAWQDWAYRKGLDHRPKP